MSSVSSNRYRSARKLYLGVHFGIGLVFAWLNGVHCRYGNVSTASAAAAEWRDAVDICDVAVGGQLVGPQSSSQCPSRSRRSRRFRSGQRMDPSPCKASSAAAKAIPLRWDASLPTGTRGLIMLETFSMTDFSSPAAGRRPCCRCDDENYRLSLMSLEGAGDASRGAVTNYIWRRDAVMSWRTLFLEIIVGVMDSRNKVMCCGWT